MEKLIACIEKLPCLYDMKSKEYENRTLKTQAYNTIVKEMQKLKSSITLGEIKRKWKSLRTMYCQEIRRMKQSQRSGAENTEEYIPKLWCFQQLNYLRKHTEGRKTTGKFKVCITLNSNHVFKHNFIYTCINYKCLNDFVIQIDLPKSL